jgi:two-component system sensor histidine kinase UhpB
VTNVARHASATRLTIRVARSRELDAGDAVTLSITDDGRGAELGETHDGLGLIGMRERVEMLGGQLHIATSPGRGFDLLARIPVSD